jgi:rhomboid protease GluP
MLSQIIKLKMAVGFTPKHIEDFPLDDLTSEQFLVIAIETANKMGWEIGYASYNGLVAYTNNGMFSWNAEIKIKIEDGIAKLNSSSVGNEMVDWGKNKRNINKFILAFQEQKSLSTDDELVGQFNQIKQHLVPQEEDILILPPQTTKEKISDFFSIFIPSEEFYVTPILLDINILIFIAMALTGVNIMQPDSESLLKWGANFRPMTLDGEPWRLLTNCFLHIGIFHLLMNMYALLYIGSLLEPYLGKTRFISAYILTGLTASMASLWWHDLTISAGASGAIFGMYGVFLAMLTTNLIEKTARKALLSSISVFVGYNLIFGLKGGIDNAAHIGGLVGGIIIGYAFIPSLKNPDAINLKWSTIGLLTVLILSTSFVVYKKIPNDIGKYYTKIKDFSVIESMALEYYSLPEDEPKDKRLYELKDRGIYYWQRNITLLDSCKRLDLPLEIRTRNRLLREYCDLRIKSYELMYKAVSEDTDKYKDQIDSFDKQIETVVNNLGGGQEKNK